MVAGGGTGDVEWGTREQCGSNEECTGSAQLPKNLTTGPIWLVAGRGGGGGHQSSVGATKCAPVLPLSP